MMARARSRGPRVKVGIRVKVIAIPSAILLLAIALNTLLLASRFRADLGKSVQSNVRLVGLTLKLQMERILQLGFRIEEVEGFDDQCRQVIADLPEQSFATIIDEKSRVYADSRREASARVLGVNPGTLAQGGILPGIGEGGATLAYAVPVHSNGGETVAWAVVGLPRDVADARVRQATYWSLAVAGVSLPAAVGLLWVALSAAVTRRLSTFVRTIEEIRTSGRLDRPVEVRDQDELGQLGGAFNAMLESIRERDARIQKHLEELQGAHDLLEERVAARTAELTRANADLQAEMAGRKEAERKREQMQMELMEASRRAGMADVATGVLHNVGNVLNSINVSTQSVLETVKTSRLANFVKAAGLMEEHAADIGAFLTTDARGKQMPVFLGKLARVLTEEQSRMREEVEGLTRNVEHIREVVSMQQSLARAAGVEMEVKLGDLLADALKINEAGLHRHAVEVVHAYEPGLVVRTDRHKALQILINLVSNAKYAIDEARGTERRMTLRAAERGGFIDIAVVDTGGGIAPENMHRIFGFGFTTKKDGHGFGLHASALAAKELGGALVAQSDGPGRGATFTLSLPCRKEAAVHA